MAQYLAPGVYIEEIQTGPRPIEGVSTSTTGFVGQTERGPTHPRMVTSWEEYYRWYGDYVDRVPGGTVQDGHKLGACSARWGLYRGRSTVLGHWAQERTGNPLRTREGGADPGTSRWREN